MIINNNMSAMNAHRQLGANQGMAAKAQEKLSSGLRINRAGDDAAGLAISEKMRAQVRGLDQASRNAQDGISMIQTAEGALNETHSILQRMRELAVQSSNDTNTESDRAEIQKEVDELAKEITRISNDTEFNTQKLINGEKADGVTFQIGANSNQSISISFSDMSADALGVGKQEWTAATVDGDSVLQNASGTTVGTWRDAVDEDVATGVEAQVAGYYNGDTLVHAAAAAATDGDTVEGGEKLDVSNRESADAAISTIQSALDQVSAERSKLGATQNRLEHTISNLDNSSENIQAAESRIRDVDMAKEIMEFTKQNILSQASQSMLAQANQAPQQVLQLLG
ncbi:flagellin [Alkalihalobacillus sp. LMS6]|jgi:flagellin|uniref:flagellin N-terminal helical domain-containing protein n=1 Tax=Bacillaceae TaxID=186817 RepID=UPI000C06DE5B|nr:MULTISPECIES: flagellin [Bacillaceae]UTR06059.1 flagellin [Alkalihalobacillus sp. LMS6]